MLSRDAEKGWRYRNTGSASLFARRGVRTLAAEVHELQVGLVKVLQERHGLLEVIAGLGRHPQLIALDLAGR